MLLRRNDMRKNNQDKVDELESFIKYLFTPCCVDCKNCALENICDDLDNSFALSWGQ